MSYTADQEATGQAKVALLGIKENLELLRNVMHQVGCKFANLAKRMSFIKRNFSTASLVKIMLLFGLKMKHATAN